MGDRASDFSAFLHIAGLAAMPLGVLDLVIGTVLARSPKASPVAGAIMQWTGLGFVAMGVIFYLRHWDDLTTLEVGVSVGVVVFTVGLVRSILTWRGNREQIPQ